jgi:hypothetical protein
VCAFWYLVSLYYTGGIRLFNIKCQCAGTRVRTRAVLVRGPLFSPPAYKRGGGDWLKILIFKLMFDLYVRACEVSLVFLVSFLIYYFISFVLLFYFIYWLDDRFSFFVLSFLVWLFLCRAFINVLLLYLSISSFCSRHILCFILLLFVFIVFLFCLFC